MAVDAQHGGRRQDGGGARGRGGLWRPIALVGLVVVVLVLSRVFNAGAQLEALRGWIASLGAWGPAVFILLYIAATVAALPGSVLTVAAGALFGTVKGVIYVSIASTAGASSAFLIGRYFARGAIERRFSANETFRRLDDLVGMHGVVIVALTRLVPIFPFNLLNYGFGLTRVPFRQYVFWSWLCMLPGTAVYVAGADAVAMGAARKGFPWAAVAVFAASAVLVVFLARHARRALKAGRCAARPKAPEKEGES